MPFPSSHLNQIAQMSALRDAQEAMLRNQSAMGGLSQGLYQNYGQACGSTQSRLVTNKKKPILGLDKGEKARDYLQRKIDGWLSEVKLFD